MPQPGAKQDDVITAIDTHIVMVPTPTGSVPAPLPHPFIGKVDGNLSSNVNIMGKPAATQGSTGSNQPPHVALPPGISFQVPPTNKATIMAGSSTVNINGKPAARMGDQVQTCADPVPNTSGMLIAVSTVMIGG